MMQKTPPPQSESARQFSPLLVGGAGALALLSASCCVLPIGLSILGIGGAWLSVLGPFVAHRSAILVVVGLVLIWSIVRLVRKPPCRGRRAGSFLILGFAVLAFVTSATAPLWEVQAQRMMWSIWRESRS